MRFEGQFTNVEQQNNNFMLTTFTAEVLSKITYTAIRGIDDEIGSVQRILIERRIKSLKDFVLNGGDFPGCIVLNWVSQTPLNIESPGR